MPSYIYEAYKIKKSLDNLGQSPVSDDGEIKGKDSDSLVTSFHLLPFAFAALGVVGIAMVVMIISALLVVDVSSTLIIALGFLGVWQKGRLARLGGIRGNINKLRGMVNEMTSENDKLTASNDKLQAENDQLSYVTRDIESLAGTMGIGVERLNSSIQELEEITQEMDRCLESQVLQQVMDIVLKVDRDQDFHIKEPKEVKRLQQRLSNIPGVEFDEENFRKITQYDSEDFPGIKLDDIMAMFRNLKDPNVAEEDSIFRLAPEDHICKVYVQKRDSGVYGQNQANSLSSPIGAAAEKVKAIFNY